MIKISAVISVYNKENYLKRCLDSIVNQTIGMDNIEVICVDDKSTDTSLEILKEYSLKYNNFHVVESEKNSGGPGAPRNKGLAITKGKYTFFVDADDYLGLESFERMYKFAEKNNSDVLLVKQTGVGRSVAKSMFKKSENNVTLANSNIIYTLHSLKLFKTKMLKENDIKFPHNVIFSEDQPFTLKAYLTAKVISILSDGYDHYYLTRTDGYHCSSKPIAPSKYYPIFSQMVKDIDNSNLSRKDKDKVINLFIERHINTSRTRAFIVKRYNEEEFKNSIHDFVLNIPERIDKYMKSPVKIRIKLIRNKEFDTLYAFEIEQRKNEFPYKIIDNKLIPQYKSLEGFNFTYNDLDMAYSVKLKYLIEKMNFDNNIFSISGNLHYNLIEDYSGMKVKGVLINRNNKLKKYCETSFSNNKFELKVYFDDLVKTSLDFGKWDLFLEISDLNRIKNLRIGKNRNLKSNFNKFYYWDYKFTSFIISLFFTKPHNNISFTVKEVKSLNFTIKTDKLYSKYHYFFKNENLKISSSKNIFKIDKIIRDETGTNIIISKDLDNNKFLLNNYVNISNLDNNVNNYCRMINSSLINAFKWNKLFYIPYKACKYITMKLKNKLS